MKIIQRIFSKIFKKQMPEPQKPQMQIVTEYPPGYNPPTQKSRTVREIIKCRKAHDCKECGNRIYAGSFICREKYLSGYYQTYSYLCLECAKKYKKMNATIQNNNSMFNKNNMFAKIRGQE